MIFQSIIIIIIILESFHKSLTISSPSQILTTLEVLLGEASETLFLKVLGTGTGEGDVHQLTLDIQVPAAPQRVDAAVAIDGIAVQT